MTAKQIVPPLLKRPVDGENFSDVKEFHFTGTRTEIKSQAVKEALKLLTKYVT